MGGYGSGRPGWRPKAEQFRSLDVNRLRKAGLLKAGYSRGWQWTVDGEKVASISVRAEGSRLVLVYRIKPNGGEWEGVEEPVPLTATDCPYGGARVWFRCPAVRNGQYCGRRVGKLFLGQRYFVCRHCLQLAYASQSEEPMHRHNRRANKIRMALGGEPGTASLPPRKPKGMHWRTYWRKMDAIDAADAAGELDFAYWVYRRFPGISPDDLRCERTGSRPNQKVPERIQVGTKGLDSQTEPKHVRSKSRCARFFVRRNATSLPTQARQDR